LSEVIPALIDKGSLGIFIIILIYTVHQLDKRMSERTETDLKVFESIDEKLNESNQLFKVMIDEHKITREFFKSTVEHERNTSEKCYDTIHKTQLHKKEMLIEINSSLKSLHNRFNILNSTLKDSKKCSLS